MTDASNEAESTHQQNGNSTENLMEPDSQPIHGLMAPSSKLLCSHWSCGWMLCNVGDWFRKDEGTGWNIGGDLCVAILLKNGHCLVIVISDDWRDTRGSCLITCSMDTSPYCASYLVNGHACTCYVDSHYCRLKSLKPYKVDRLLTSIINVRRSGRDSEDKPRLWTRNRRLGLM